MIGGSWGSGRWEGPRSGADPASSDHWQQRRVQSQGPGLNDLGESQWSHWVVTRSVASWCSYIPSRRESFSWSPKSFTLKALKSDGFCFQLEQKPGVCMSESFSSTRQVVDRSLGWFGPRHSPFSRGSSSELLNQRWTASFFFGVNGLKQHVHLSQVELQGAGRL